MEPDRDEWQWRVRGSYSCLTYEPWFRSGIDHGFIGTQGSFAARGLNFTEIDKLDEEGIRFTAAIGCQSIVLLKQVHGPIVQEVAQGIVRVPTTFAGIGDAAIATVTERRAGALGVCTADCVPLLLHAGAWVGVVHAGWRGLSVDNSVIHATVALLAQHGAREFRCLIGPAASADKAGSYKYEVGEEVVAAIGSAAVTTQLGGGKYLLNLAATASVLIRDAVTIAGGEVVELVSSEQCTLTNTQFHSYRRDGALAGRNLSFIIF